MRSVPVGSAMAFYACRQTRARAEVLKSPAGPLAKRFEEWWSIGLLGCRADPIVEKLGIPADEDAPFLRLHTIEDDGGCLGSGRGRAFAEAFFQFRHPLSDLIVGPAGDVDTLRGKPFAHGGNVDRRIAAPQHPP